MKVKANGRRLVPTVRNPSQKRAVQRLGLRGMYYSLYRLELMSYWVRVGVGIVLGSVRSCSFLTASCFCIELYVSL